MAKGPSQTSSSSEEEEDDSYTTRCICGLTHDDGSMIACDTCDVWQHMVCMGLNRKRPPEEYFCELCKPR